MWARARESRWAPFVCHSAAQRRNLLLPLPLTLPVLLPSARNQNFAQNLNYFRPHLTFSPKHPQKHQQIRMSSPKSLISMKPNKIANAGSPLQRRTIKLGAELKICNAGGDASRLTHALSDIYMQTVCNQLFAGGIYHGRAQISTNPFVINFLPATPLESNICE
jgi:hypothetical protein